MGVQNVVGDQVRQIRSRNGWSQADLAAKCNLAKWDVSRGTLSKIEAKLRRVTDAEVFLLAKVLQVEIAALYPPDENISAALRRP